MNPQHYMRFALDLARSMQGQTTPNPLVVKDGQIIGTGAHLKAGTPHAEVYALLMTGTESRGADLYLTLEPCAHTGKTPPCTDLTITSGIHRVFVASFDSNPSANGTGIGLLKVAEIEAVTGILQEEAEQMNRAFFHLINYYGKPYHFQQHHDDAMHLPRHLIIYQ